MKVLKKKLPSIRRRKKVLWELCKQITRKRYVNQDGTWNCYTCDKKIDVPKNAHTGHCVPQAFGGLYLRYDLRNLRIQDFRCNINYGGNGGVYVMRLRKEIGDDNVVDMFTLLDRKNEKKTSMVERMFIEDKIEEYRKILHSL